MGLKALIKSGKLEVWKDVYDPRIDDKTAPNLSDVYLGNDKDSIYSNPDEFFKRTYRSDSMEELLIEANETLRGGKGNRIFLLTSSLEVEKPIL